jgi:hypothetical protein
MRAVLPWTCGGLLQTPPFRHTIRPYPLRLSSASPAFRVLPGPRIVSAARPLLTIITCPYVHKIAHSPVYVDLALRRREAVTLSGSRTVETDVQGGEQGPGYGGGVEGVQVVEVADCRRRRVADWRLTAHW